MPKKIFLKEDQVKLLKEYNCPDIVALDHETLKFTDNDAVTFFLHPIYGFCVDSHITHSELIDDIIVRYMNIGFDYYISFEKALETEFEPEECRQLIDEFNELQDEFMSVEHITGRYWSNHDIISFWTKLPDEKSFNVIINELKLDMSTLRIALEYKIVNANEIYDKSDSEFIFNDKKQEQAKALHLMNAEEKAISPQMQDYLHNRSENIGKKLSYDNKKGEMPMAQYRALHTTSENVEKDKYILGDEGCGNFDYTHIQESFGQNKYVDRDAIDKIEYFVTEPEDEDEENYYEIECFDRMGERIYFDDYLTFDDLWDVLGSKLATLISTDEDFKSGKWNTIDEIIYNSQNDLDDSNVDAVNSFAKRFFQTSEEYLGNDRGYILTDGTILEFGPNIDHASISSVGHQTIGSFLSLGNIRIGVQSIELATEPTFAQRKQLRKLIQHYSNSEIYVDIIKYNGDGMYGQTLTSAKYENPTFNKVLGEIDRYFNEGIKLRGGYCRDDDDLYENIQYEVKPEEVDLSSFTKSDKLNPDIWKNENKIDSRVRLQLLDIADDFFNSLEISFIEPNDIILTGSICNFNWSDKSDIDLHIVLDFKEIGENIAMIEDYFNAKKNEWNQNHQNLQIYGLNVEVYVEDVNASKVSNGIYSLEKNKWIKKPNVDEVDDIEPIADDLKVLSSELMTCIDDLKDEFNHTDDLFKIEEILDTLNYLWSFVKEMRKQSLNNEGEYSKGNIIYKILRRNGYLDTIFELKNIIYDKLNSIS